MFQEGSNEDNEGWKMPRRKARLKPSSLRAPQPDVATPVKPAPHLSAPQPKEATVAKPLCAPQPFSNGPGADIDGTERRYKRKTRVSSNHRRKSGSSSNSSNSKRRSSRRVYRERKNSTTSRTSRTSKCSFGSGNTMEPEDDAGAQPLQGNIVRKPSFVASLAEASNVPYAAVAVVGSSSTAQTTETSFDQSAVSNNRPLHYNNSSTTPATVTRQNSYRRKFPPHSWASKTSFTGEIVSSSRPRMSSITNTDDGYRNVQQGRVSTSARSGTTTEDRFSLTSFSMEMGYPDSREISREFSIVASVVDEAQLEAEFAERMKSRIVEAVEIRPSITGDEEDPRSSNSNSYTNNNRGVCNSHSGSNSNSSDQEVVNQECAPGGDGNDTGESLGEQTQTPSPRELVRIKQRKQTIQGIVAWTGFFLVIAILVVVVVVVFRASRSSN